MSLLLDALRKAALEKQQASLATQEKSSGAPIHTFDQREGSEPTVKSIPPVVELNITTAAANEVAQVEAKDLPVQGSLSLELELQDDFLMDDRSTDSDSARAEVSQPLNFGDDLQGDVELQGAAPSSAAMIMDDVDSFFEKGHDQLGFGEQQGFDEQPSFGDQASVDDEDFLEDIGASHQKESFEYQDSNLEGNDLADDIFAQFQQQRAKIVAPVDSIESTAKSTGPKVVSDADIEAMIAGAYSASSPPSDDASNLVDDSDGSKKPKKESKKGDRTNSNNSDSNSNTASVSEDALHQLINQSRKEKTRETYRRVALVVLLMCIAFGLGGVYYYIDVNSNQMSPIVTRAEKDAVALEEYDANGNLVAAPENTEGSATTQDATTQPAAVNEANTDVAGSSNVTTGAFVNKPGNKESANPNASSRSEVSQSTPSQSNNTKVVGVNNAQSKRIDNNSINKSSIENSGDKQGALKQELLKEKRESKSAKISNNLVPVRPEQVASSHSVNKQNRELEPRTISSKTEQEVSTKTEEDLAVQAYFDAMGGNANRARNPVQITLADAYLAYQDNQILEAQALYEKVLRVDNKNRDALLGLSAIATKLGDYERALEHYETLLNINPADDLAQVGLMQVSFQHDSTQVETRLKLYIAKSPNSAFLRFALGNVYANRRHWPSAAQQFKEAVALDPMNAEFNYNLAVSYDQLSNRNDALFKYQQALSLSLGRNVNFSLDAVRKRITQLQSNSSASGGR